MNPIAPIAPPPPVVRFAPLRLVPPEPEDRIVRHLITQAMVAEVRRALAAWSWAYEASL